MISDWVNQYIQAPTRDQLLCYAKQHAKSILDKINSLEHPMKFILEFDENPDGCTIHFTTPCKDDPTNRVSHSLPFFVYQKNGWSDVNIMRSEMDVKYNTWLLDEQKKFR